MFVGVEDALAIVEGYRDKGYVLTILRFESLEELKNHLEREPVITVEAGLR